MRMRVPTYTGRQFITNNVRDYVVRRAVFDGIIPPYLVVIEPTWSKFQVVAIKFSHKRYASNKDNRRR